MDATIEQAKGWARLDIAAYYARTYREQLDAVLKRMKPNVYGLGTDNPTFSGSQMTWARAEAHRRAAAIVEAAGV